LKQNIGKKAFILIVAMPSNFSSPLTFRQISWGVCDWQVSSVWSSIWLPSWSLFPVLWSDSSQHYKSHQNTLNFCQRKRIKRIETKHQDKGFHSDCSNAIKLFIATRISANKLRCLWLPSFFSLVLYLLTYVESFFQYSEVIVPNTIKVIKTLWISVKEREGENNIKIEELKQTSEKGFHSDYGNVVKLFIATHVPANKLRCIWLTSFFNLV